LKRETVSEGGSHETVRDSCGGYDDQSRERKRSAPHLSLALRALIDAASQSADSSSEARSSLAKDSHAEA
jgi:hypothetical protein